MGARPTHDIAVKTGQYTKDGENRNSYQKIGAVFKHDDGGTSINLNPKPHFPSVHSCVILSKNSSINYLKSS
jgi:hypothetical protein